MSGTGRWAKPISALVVTAGLFLSFDQPLAEPNGGSGAASSMAVENEFAVRSQFDDFVGARVAAEVCRGLTFSQSEEEHWLWILSIRDPGRRSPDELASDAGSKAAILRSSVRDAGCDSPDAVRALTTWDLRVGALARIKGQEQGSPVIGSDTADRGAVAEQTDS